MKTPSVVSGLRDVVSVSVSRRGLLRMVALLLALLAFTLVLSYILLRLAPAISGFSRFGYAGVFLICLISSFTVIMPFPGTVLWLSVVVGMELNLALAATVAAIGGSLGEVTGYYLGYAGKAVIAPEDSRMYAAIEKWMRAHGAWAIFLFAFFPFLIFDFVGIASGVMRYPVRKFLLLCFVGRLPRSFIECYLYYYTGYSLLKWIVPHLPSWLQFVA